MADPWRYRPIQPSPLPPPPPHTPPFHLPIHDPNPFPPKRMRVDDSHPYPPPHPFPPPPPAAMPSSFDDERRLSLIRAHGRQDARFQEPMVLPNERLDLYTTAPSFSGHQSFHESRLFSPERLDFYSGESHRRDFYGGGEMEKTRNLGSWNWAEPSYMDRMPLESKFEPYGFRPKVFEEERKLPPPSPLEGYDLMGRVRSPQRYPLPFEGFVNSRYKESNPYRTGSYPPPFEPYMPSESNAYRTGSSLHNESSAYRTDSTVTRSNPPFESYASHAPNESYAYSSLHNESNGYRMDSAVIRQVPSSQLYPPLPPPQPPIPPPPPPEPLVASHFEDTRFMGTPAPMSSLAPAITAPLFPIAPYRENAVETRSLAKSNLYGKTVGHTSAGFTSEGLATLPQTTPKKYEERQTFPANHSIKVEPTVVDACHLFRQPHRASRPDRIVVILRGLPGSGKSYMAKALRDIEVESGGNAPRIHAIDDYFMIEVEKVEENEGSKSSGSSRGKKQISKKVIEYCYEPEMEEAYRSSMLKAFKKTLDEGNFAFIIVDDRNLRVADFAQFWAIAKRSGYEVYLLEAAYKDPLGCAARNVHGFTVDDIQKMAEQWEEAPSLYLQLDIQSLFRGDSLNQQSIQEVDMDTDDSASNEEERYELQPTKDLKITEPLSSSHTLDDDSVKIGERWNADNEEEEELTKVKDLGSSKWSKNVDDDIDNLESAKTGLSALSGLIQAYGKSEKSVHWGDQVVGKRGFSIGAARKHCRSSLIIGPGSGYNLNSNPSQEDDDTPHLSGKTNMNESKKRFTEQLRAERESFKAVFDRRRRIGGLWDAEDE